MKNAFLILAFIATAFVCVPVRATTAFMNNRKIQEMLSGGIPLSFILRSIRTAKQVDLYINDREYKRLLNAGASKAEADAIMKAINDREWNGADTSPGEPIDSESMKPAPALEAPPVTSAYAAQGEGAVVSVPAVARAVVPPPVAMHQIVLEDATPVRLRLTRSLNSADAIINEKVDFEVEEDIRIGDQIVVPRNAVAWGIVTEAESKTIMGDAGKLEVKVEAVRLADGEKALLRGVKDANGAGRPASVTAEDVALSGIRRQEATLLLLVHSKDLTIPEGREVTAYIDGNVTLDASKFARQ